MRHLPKTSHRAVAIAALAANIAVLGGCSNTSISPLAQNAAPSRGVISDGYSFQTVDGPQGDSNEITGINNNGEIVGNYTGPNGHNWKSYIAAPGYTDLNLVTFPQNFAKYTYLYGMNDAATIMVGYVNNPQGLAAIPWGVVGYQGLWSLIHLGHNENKDCHTTTGTQSRVLELTGFDNNSSTQVAVGWWNDPARGTMDQCLPTPFILFPGDNMEKQPTRFEKKIPSTWLNTYGTGIDSNDNTVGSTTFKPGSTPYNKPPSAGWFLGNDTAASLETFWCCSGSTLYSTTFNGVTKLSSVSPEDEIVGTYTVGSGANAQQHGFVLHLTQTSKGTEAAWTAPVDPAGSTYTVINGVNAAGDICGWYSTGGPSGQYLGFVGHPTGVPFRRRHQRRIVLPPT